LKEDKQNPILKEKDKVPLRRQKSEGNNSVGGDHRRREKSRGKGVEETRLRSKSEGKRLIFNILCKGSYF